MSRRRVLAVAVVGLLGSGALPAGGAEALAARTVHIGVMGDLTGENALLVMPVLNGVRLAVDRYNATKPRVRIKVIAYDTQARPDHAVSLAKAAVTRDRLVGLVGPAFSGESAAVGPILEEAGVPSITPSASAPGLAGNGWRYWHRIIADYAEEGSGLGRLIGTGLKGRRIFFVDDRSSYGQAVAAGAKRSARKTAPKAATRAARLPANAGGAEVKALVAKVRSFRPDVVFYGGMPEDAGRLVKGLRNARVSAKFVVSDIGLDPLFAKTAGKRAAEGTFVSCGCLLDPRGKTSRASKAFASAYNKAYASPPPMYAAEAYDAATAFVRAVKSGATTPKGINTYLSRVSLPGVTKRIAFKRNGEPKAGRIYVYRRHGKTLPLYKRF